MARKSNREKGGLTLNALALRCSPAVIAANPHLFPEAGKMVTSSEHPPASSEHLIADGLTLTLAGYLPDTPNTLRGKHWSVIATAKKSAALALARALLDAGIVNPPRAPKTTRWQLHIIRSGPGELDRDNLAAAYKQLQDAIVDAGLIPGDKPRVLWATHIDRPEKDERRQGTTVMLQLVADKAELVPWYPDIGTP